MTERAWDLTDEQKAVVSEPETAFVVRAAAGTGKTTTLVARYLRHVLEDGLRPDEILTITFTRKAAAEMKRRIVDALVKNGLRDEAQVAETGPIQTIHGYCERILRECSVDAGLDPDFQILDETESSRRMKSAIRDAIGSLEEMPLAERLLEHLAGKRKYMGTSPHSLLEEAVGNAVARLRGSTASLEFLERQYASEGAVVKFWRESILETTPLPVREALAGSEPGQPFGVRLQQAYKVSKIKAPTALPTPSGAELAASLEEECAALSCGLMQLALRTWRSFERANEELGDLDFVELERRTVELLRTSSHALDRIRKQYRAALVDESQDMNPIQHRLLEAMGIERQMLVGDAQQSIYGFRQADVRLFEEKASRSKALPLSSNKRSEQGILRFVDELFGRIWSGRYVPMANSAPAEQGLPRFDGVELWRQKARDTSQIADWIGELVREEGAGNIAVLTRTSGYAQDLLAKLELRNVPARIAGGSERYYTRLEVRDLANCLLALVDPSDAFALLATLRSPACGLSMDAIVLLAAEGDPWRSLPTFEAPSPEDAALLVRFLEWFEPLSRRADRLAAWEVVSEVLAKSPYLATVASRQNGVQALANLRKLLSIAAGMPDPDVAAFARRIRETREIRHHEGDAPATEDESNQVTILTIHKAKGLEFEVVVVPETLANERRKQEVEIEKDTGMLTVSFSPGGACYHNLNTQWRKDRDRQELHRLLYVALTRAKRRLCLVVDPEAPPSKLAGEIMEHLGWREGIPHYVRVRTAEASPASE